MQQISVWVVQIFAKRGELTYVYVREKILIVRSQPCSEDIQFLFQKANVVLGLLR